ncbi:MAG: EAL domain-containing protein [Burkholderiaceae bacterium]
MSTAAKHDTRHARLLVVDDDAMWRYLVTSALRERGFMVEEYDSAAALLEAVGAPEAARAPDMLLIDALMPGVSGFDLCRRLREQGPLQDTPILMMTSLDDDSSISRAYEVGATDFFIKSTHWTLLAERIRQVLRQASQRERERAPLAGASATLDELTGLPQRTAFLGDLQRLLEANLDPGPERDRFAVLVLDMDRFRAVNESFGLRVADQLLARVATRLADTGPRSLARLLGDKFALAYGGCHDDGDVGTIVAKVRSAFADPFDIEGHECFLSVSIGVAGHPDDGNDAALLLSHAEAALGEAKENGRNQVMRFVHREAASGRRRLDLSNALHRALERGQISLQYQPVIDIRGSGSWSVEALMRWKHDGQWVPPSEFIPIAEESGLIVPLGEWAIRQALAQLATWRAWGHGVEAVAVNIPAQHVGRPSLEATIRESLAQTGLSGRALAIELTESGLMHDVDSSLEQLARFDAMGVQLAIDDFGTGYSSLSRLTRLPIDTLKIDRSFVLQLGIAREEAAVVRAIVALARGLSMDVVAEGVETEEHMARLRAIGCHRFQGFLISRPRPACEIEFMEAAVRKWFTDSTEPVRGMTTLVGD